MTSAHTAQVFIASPRLGKDRTTKIYQLASGLVTLPAFNKIGQAVRITVAADGVSRRERFVRKIAVPTWPKFECHTAPTHVDLRTALLGPLAWSRRLASRERMPHAVRVVCGLAFILAAYATSAFANENMPFQPLNGDSCFMFSLLVPANPKKIDQFSSPLEIIINNLNDYEKLFDPKILKQSCANVDRSKFINEVDFSRNVVLGMWSEGSCVDIGFDRRVLRDDVNKTIIYSVSPVAGTKRACMGPGPASLNLIAISSIPAGYQVVFENIRD